MLPLGYVIIVALFLNPHIIISPVLAAGLNSNYSKRFPLMVLVLRLLGCVP